MPGVGSELGRTVSLSVLASLTVLALASFLLTGVIRRLLLHFQVLDVATGRSSHSGIQVRGGGLSFLLIFLVVIASGLLDPWLTANVRLALMGGGVLVAGAGFWDDARQLAVLPRLVVQLVAAGWVVFMVGGVAIPEWIHAPSLTGEVLAVVILVWMINAFNFMDGIDGIAATEAILVAVFAAVILYQCGDPAYLAWMCLGAAVLGFLPWNLPRARIFMGDTGSCFLGLTIGTLALASLHGGSPVSLWTWGILMGAFLVDATVTLVRRIIRGETWHQAHRSHAYQHLSRKWDSHGRVTSLYALVNLLVLGPAAYWTIAVPRDAAAIAMVVLLTLVLAALRIGAGLPDGPMRKV